MHAASRWGGIAALAGICLFIAVVAVLHAVQDGYDPSSQLMSELALGRYGGAMLLAFAGIAVAVAAIAFGIAPLGASPGLRLLFIVSAAFFLAAGIFPLGETSLIHIGAIAMAFVVCVLAIYLYPSLAGKAAALAPRAWSWTIAAAIASSVALGHSLIPMGIGQRMAALFLLVWIGALGWRLARLRGSESRRS